jgi:hypothetical protein
MECGLFRLLMQRYYDGELDEAERAEYENHRRRCDACRVMDNRFAHLIAALDETPLFEPAFDFNRRVLARVNVGAYRRSPVSGVFDAIGRCWGAIPVPVRNGAIIALVCAAIVAVYKPFLDYIVSTVEQGAIALWSGMAVMSGLLDKVGVVWNGMGTARNYEVVGRTLLRTFRRAVPGSSEILIVAVVAALVLIGIIVSRRLIAARNKGETHVSIL